MSFTSINLTLYYKPHNTYLIVLFSVSSRFSGTFPIPQSATFLQDDSSAKVVLLGTVHFSKQSIEDVSDVGIYVELRYLRIN